MINALESLILKDLKERSGLILSMLFLLILTTFMNPAVKYILLIILFGNLLSRSIYNGKISLLTTMPVSYNHIYWSSFFLMSGLVLFSSAMSCIVFRVPATHILTVYIFSLAFWAISIICSLFKLEPIGIPLIIFILDSFLGFFPIIGQNTYTLVSPFYQGNIFAAAVFSLILVVTSWLLFLKRGVVR